MTVLGRLLRASRSTSYDLVVAGNIVTYLPDGPAALEAMLEAIASATREIVLEMYWFDSDRVGRRFAEALSERARSGVSVRVIYDAVGSLGVDPEMFEDMRRAGCLVHEYNPIAPWRKRVAGKRNRESTFFTLLNRRDHRKILAVDGRIAFTGGINLADHWMGTEKEPAWRDEMVRVGGPAAAHLRAAFFVTWSEYEPSTRSEISPRSTVVEDAHGGSSVRVLLGDGRRDRRAIRRAYARQIRRATKHIYIANSYFLPDMGLRNALVRAARRGVDVRIMVPGTNDVLAMYYAMRKLYTKLVPRGVRVYEWHGSILHSKTAVIDDRWSTVGSFNLDHRSVRYNLEANVVVEDEAFASALHARFLKDLESCTPVLEESLAARPLFTRILEEFFFLFRKVL